MIKILKESIIQKPKLPLLYNDFIYYRVINDYIGGRNTYPSLENLGIYIVEKRKSWDGAW